MKNFLKISTIALVIFATSLLGMTLFVVHNGCVDLSLLERYQPAAPSLLLDDEGNEWGRFQLDRRDPVTLDKIPPHLIQAFLAAEDHEFFSHHGISLRGVARSLLVNIYHGRKAQGASTITQQLVKLIYFDSAKTFKRKIKEQIMALVVERQCTKEQILEVYLNHVYLGCGIYGVQAACQRFWAKDVWDISVDQAAVLAAIVRSPGNYCPLLFPLSSEHRRNIVLNSMHKLGFISTALYEQAKEQPVAVIEPDTTELAPHLKETIRMFVQDLVGKEQLYGGGLRIATTLNQKAQRSAQKSFSKNFAVMHKQLRPDVDGALVSVDVKTGGIKALVGGANFAASKFNRALQARRQMGSSFKPLVFAVALMNGKSFDDTEIDEPFTLEQHGSVWSPKNFNGQFGGQMTLAKALFTSNNIVTIKTFLSLNPYEVIDLAKSCRLKDPLHAYPSLSLGCVDQTLCDVVGMFNVFANDGVYVEPHYISWIKDAWGTKIYKTVPEVERVMPAHIAGQVARVMGIGFNKKRYQKDDGWVDAQAFRKTGTTNDSRTCWFLGSTPLMTTGVYVGCDDNQSMGQDIYPVRTAFPLWLDMMKGVSFNNAAFTYSPLLQEVVVHKETGKVLPSPDCEGAITLLKKRG